MTVKAVYEDGVLKLKEPLPFKEHEEVEIVGIRSAAAASTDAVAPSTDHDDPTGWKAIDSLRGIVKGAPQDVAKKHDNHLD